MKKKRELQVFLLGSLFGVLLALFPWGVLFLNAAEAAQGFLSLRRSRKTLAPMAREAERLNLGYDQIASSPGEFAGKFVVWCVDHPAPKVSYLAGKPSQPLVWENDHELPLNSPTSGGRCTKVLAAVEGLSREGVLLRYIGRP